MASKAKIVICMLLVLDVQLVAAQVCCQDQTDEGDAPAKSKDRSCKDVQLIAADALPGSL